MEFANGIVLAQDRSFVLVAETAAYRIARHHLTGPRAAATAYLVQSLPECPDNLGLGSDGLLWVALVSPRNRLLDMLLPLPGVLGRIVRAVPLRAAAEICAHHLGAGLRLRWFARARSATPR